MLVEHVQEGSFFSRDFNRPSAADRAMVGLGVAWAITAAVVATSVFRIDLFSPAWRLWALFAPFVLVAAVPLAMPTTRSLRIAGWVAAGLLMLSLCASFFLSFWFAPAALPLACAGTSCPRVRPPLAHLCVAAVLGAILLWFAQAAR